MSVTVLDELMRHGMLPGAIVTSTDKPKGRKLILTPPEAKTFADMHGIPAFQFDRLDSGAIDQLRAFMSERVHNGTAKTTSDQTASDKASVSHPIEYFLVASYGLIIPQAVLDLPPFGTLNIHPSLLPEYRGATPLQQAILDDKKDTGVTIMQVDAKMDHGPILFQEKRNPAEPWPKRYAEFENEMARQGARMIADNIHKILGTAGSDGTDTVMPREQDHARATCTKKISKADGEIDISDSALRGETGRKQFLKFNAYSEWPTTFFFAKTAKTKSANDTTSDASDNSGTLRIKITDAIWDNDACDGAGEMKILKVVPEGQKETSWNEFKKKLM